MMKLHNRKKLLWRGQQNKFLFGNARQKKLLWCAQQNNYFDVLGKKKKNILMGSPKNIFKILKYKEIPTKVKVTSHLEVNWGKNKPCLYIWKEKIHFLAKGKEKYLKSCQVDEIRKYNKKGLKLTAAKEVHKGRRWMAIPISVDLRKKWRKYKRC